MAHVGLYSPFIWKIFKMLQDILLLEKRSFADGALRHLAHGLNKGDHYYRSATNGLRAHVNAMVLLKILYLWIRSLQYESAEITNKMQPCNRICYSKVYSKVYFHFSLNLDNDRLPHGYINQRMQIQFRAPDDERFAA